MTQDLFRGLSFIRLWEGSDMSSKIKKLYRAVAKKLLAPNVLQRIECELRNIKLSPVDQHVFLSSLYNEAGLFHPSYEDWRIKRVNKILELYGIDYFEGKNLLELGGGHGEIGAFFAELGANVLCLEGRMQNVNYASLKHRKVANFKCKHFNLEHDFSEFGRFDLIINFGLLYHLQKVDEHLNCCFRMSDDILFESVVCDSTDPYKIFFCDENKDIDEEALEGIGSRPSPFYIERIAKEHHFESIRYFNADLNSGKQFIYDWKHKNDNRPGEGFKLRRFWRFKKMATST
jgi:2-polyprenyl-3-methyl-5-hydroxy-6-metoxy-1,4-benzoquinol methylase